MVVIDWITVGLVLLAVFLAGGYTGAVLMRLHFRP